jgi:hypothetical protein
MLMMTTHPSDRYTVGRSEGNGQSRKQADGEAISLFDTRDQEPPGMEDLSVGIGMKLCWVQPKACERRYELRSGQELFATLSWEVGGGAVATAASAGSCWTFKQVGLHNRHVTVREAGTGMNVAVYRPRWLGDGSVQFSDGRVYRWRSEDFWATHWCFHDNSGNALLSFQRRVEHVSQSALFRAPALVEVHSVGLALAELPLLMLLGWYVLIFRQQAVDAVARAPVGATAACAA